ncbi:2-methylfumaryl-CoA isomerase [Variovorax sp. OAS795]|uniref:CoA transferase n=1 Tax=Variovorax sp. OAS795 TaxID=3034231 RepID=UPI00339AE6E7
MNYNLLGGIRVVESSAFIAAPLAGMALAQFGADVIRIDVPGGGIDYRRQPLSPAGRSLYWTGLNKHKRSVAIDVRKPQGRELVRALIAQEGSNGGVLLTNLGAPWLSHASLAQARPDLISCTIEGNSDGSTAVDYTVNCAVGYPALTGSGDPSEPVNNVLPAWDVACAYNAAFAIATALANRRATGQGAEIRLALSDLAFATIANLGLTAEVELLGAGRRSTGNYLYGAFGKDLTTLDGERFYVAAISMNQWRSLVAASGQESAIRALEEKLDFDFGREEDRFTAREPIAALLQAWSAVRTFDEVAAQLRAHSVCWGPYQTVAQAVAADPRLSTQNEVFNRVTTQGVGDHLAAGAATRIFGATRHPVVPAPLLGQHTDEVLLDVLKLSAAEVGRLHDEAIVAGADASGSQA